MRWSSRGSLRSRCDLVAANHASEKLHGCRKLVLAAAWADLFTDPGEVPERDGDGSWTTRLDPDTAPPSDTAPRSNTPPSKDDPMRVPRRGGPSMEGFIRPGGRGTPWIAETCPAELGLWQQQSPGSARCLIGDALDLRHRLPRLWARIVAGDVHAWKARTVATRSRYLGLGPVDELDRLLADQIELLSWGRFEKILDATLLHVDPVSYQQRVEESHSRRGVWLGESAAGLRTIIVRAAQGDVAVFWAAVNLVADLLADEGDEDPVTVRRSKAIGILGNPAAALDLLNRHAGQPDPADDPTLSLPDPTDTNPWHPEPRPGWDTTPPSNPTPATPPTRPGNNPPTRNNPTRNNPTRKNPTRNNPTRKRLPMTAQPVTTQSRWTPQPTMTPSERLHPSGARYADRNQAGGRGWVLSLSKGAGYTVRRIIRAKVRLARTLSRAV